MTALRVVTIGLDVSDNVTHTCVLDQEGRCLEECRVRTTRQRLAAWLHRYPQARTILIEDAANGPAIIDALTHRIRGIVPISPEGGKLARAHAAQPCVEAGNVYLPNPRPYGRLVPERAWVEDFLCQLTGFPNGAHDDDVDAFTQLLVRWQRPQMTGATWGR